MVDTGGPTGLYLKEISGVGETTVVPLPSRIGRLADVSRFIWTWVHRRRAGSTDRHHPALSESCRDAVERAVELAQSAGS